MSADSADHETNRLSAWEFENTLGNGVFERWHRRAAFAATLPRMMLMTLVYAAGGVVFAFWSQSQTPLVVLASFGAGVLFSIIVLAAKTLSGASALRKRCGMLQLTEATIHDGSLRARSSLKSRPGPAGWSAGGRVAGHDPG